MTVAIFETSPFITDRLVDLIIEKNEGVVFKKYYNRPEAIEYLRNPLPGVILIDIRFIGDQFENMFSLYNKSDVTTLIVMYLVMDESVRNKYITMGVDQLIDLYHDFEKIPQLIKDSRKKITNE